MSQASGDGHFVVAGSAVFAGLSSGEGVIVDAQTAFYFGLNRTAAFLWQTLKERGETTPTALAESLLARFEVAPDEARRDVEHFLASAVTMGLARELKSPSAPPAP